MTKQEREKLIEQYAAGPARLKAALAAVPERAIDELAVLVTPEQCLEMLSKYVANGVTVPVLNFMSLETDASARAEESRVYLKALAPL